VRLVDLGEMPKLAKQADRALTFGVTSTPDRDADQLAHTRPVRHSDGKCLRPRRPTICDRRAVARPDSQVRGAETYRCGFLAVPKEELGGRIVTCYSVDTDIHRPTVATRQVNSKDLGGAVVRRGMALPYLRYSARYGAEVDVRRAKPGVRGFEMPEEWRLQR
jgi:hypothetical protein